MTGKLEIPMLSILLLGLASVGGLAQVQEDAAQSTRSTAIFRDAAGYQNNEAYKIAAEEWQKLIQEFPDDPLTPKARHYLGVCYIHLEEYERAIDAFRSALKDPQPELVEESKVNLGWCLFTRAKAKESGSKEQVTALREAEQQLKQFVKDYPSGEFNDQAFYFLGEIEYTLGNVSQAVNYYRALLESRDHRDSKLRADAMYALAIAYEEQGDARRARQVYQQFEDMFPEHRLQPEVAVRLAELDLAGGKLPEAEQRLRKVLGGNAEQVRDYALLRLGYIFDKQGKLDDSKKAYEKLLEDYPASPHVPAAAVSLGQLMFKQGFYDEAASRFRRALTSQDEQAADAAHWLAITLMRQGKASEAMQVVERAMRWADGSVVLELDYADALYALPNQFDKARAAYELIARQHEDDPLAPRAAYNAAFAALQARDFAGAREWSEWFLKRFPQDTLRSDVAYVAAEALLQEGEHRAAASAYRKLITADSENPAVPLWTLRMGTAFYLDGQYQQAIEVIESSLPSWQTDAAQMAEARYILGASLLYEEKLEAAIEQLSASHRADDEWTSADEVLLLLAEAQQRNRDNAAAKETLELLLKKYPQTRLKAQVEYRLGQLSAANGKYEAAITQYNSILRDGTAANYHSFARYGIAWCWMQQQRFENALPELQAVLRSDPSGPVAAESQLAYGVCLRKLERNEEAISSLQSFLKTEPTGVSLANGLYELSLALTDAGRLQEANGYLRQLLKEVPDYPSRDKVLYEMAWNYQDLGSDAEASASFAALAEQAPGSDLYPEALYMLAQEAYDEEDFAEAANKYSEVFQQANDDELREKAIYKLGWSLFQQDRFEQAQRYFEQQTEEFGQGTLAVDAFFMNAECSFERKEFSRAFEIYQRARRELESDQSRTIASPQVQSLIYLHAAQCLREAGEWAECENWLQVIPKRYPESPYLGAALYELGYCKQKQGETQAALKYYAEVADRYRTEIGARSRFMMGEIYFAERDMAKAIPQFQRVMYGFGGDNATEEIKNWQVKSAFEAARCSEILIKNLRGSAREKVIETAQEYYSFIVKKHATHDLAAQAETRLGELNRLR